VSRQPVDPYAVDEHGSTASQRPDLHDTIEHCRLGQDLCQDTCSAGSRELCQLQREANGKLVTKSNLSLRVPAQRAAVIRVINRSPKPSGRITLDIRVIIARVFDPICGDDHPYITGSARVTGIRRRGLRWAQSRVLCARSQALRGLGLQRLAGAGDD
jgi:hypothetical protein